MLIFHSLHSSKLNFENNPLYYFILCGSSVEFGREAEYLVVFLDDREKSTLSTIKRLWPTL